MRSQEPTDRPVTADWLAEHLESSILDGRAPVGSRLPSERELSNRHGLSRPVVREVLGRLAERGFIAKYPGRGAFVRDVQPVDAARPLAVFYLRQRVTARALIDARRMLEGEAAVLAAERATEAQLAELELIVARLERVRGDVLERVRADLEFHTAIVNMSGNPVIATMFGSIRRLTVQQMLRSLGDTDVTSEGIPHHREILEAIRSGDAQRARLAVSGHMGVSVQYYGPDLDEPIEDLARQAVRRLAGPERDIEGVLAELG